MQLPFPKFYLVISIILVLIVANMAFLNYTMFTSHLKANQGEDTQYHIVNVASSSGTTTPGQAQKVIDSCYPFSCVDLIREATASSISKTTASNESKTVYVASATKEFYIPLGSGQTISDQWEDAGISAYIDSTKYSNIKTVTFEATMRIPTANGRMYAQLYNSTDAHPVWFSEISMEGNKPQLLVSSPITLDKGNKLYKVQLKTTLKYQSIIDQARVHIITQ